MSVIIAHSFSTLGWFILWKRSIHVWLIHCKVVYFTNQLNNHKYSLFPFYTAWKHQKTYGFLMFSEGIKSDHRPKIFNRSNRLQIFFENGVLKNRKIPVLQSFFDKVAGLQKLIWTTPLNKPTWPNTSDLLWAFCSARQILTQKVHLSQLKIQRNNWTWII